MNNHSNFLNASSDKLRQSFTQAANSLTSFFKESLRAQSEAYLDGQIDALNELLDFCLKKYNGDIRNIPTSALLEFVNIRIMELNNKKTMESIKESNGGQFPGNSTQSLQNGFAAGSQINETLKFNINPQFNK